MALYCGRLANKQILSSMRGLPSAINCVQYSRPAPQMVTKAYEKVELEDHDTRNMKLKRPMSPHLTIYAKQLTSFTSITHRATGMVLSGYFIALGCGALVLPHDISHYMSMLEGLQLSAPTLYALKYTLALPFSYHLANGIRHLMWDTGRALTLKEVYATGYTVLGATVVITAILAAL